MATTIARTMEAVCGTSYERELKARDESGRYGTTGRYWIRRNLPDYARRYFTQRGLRVLDLGCGQGAGLSMLRGAGFAGEYLGVDLEPSPLWTGLLGEVAPLSGEFLRWDAHELGRLSRRFNAAISITAFEHFSADRAVVEGLARVLEPGAHALVVVPSPYGSAVWGFTHGFRKYTPSRIEQLIDGTPFALREAVPAGALPSLVVNGLWSNASWLAARAVRFGVYARHGWDRDAALAAHPWAADAVARVQFGHLGHPLGRALHGKVNDALYALDEQVRLCPTQWLFVLEHRG